MFDDVKHVHLIGIKGVAMTGLAKIFKALGKNVTGSDLQQSFITDHILQDLQINISYGFRSENLPVRTDLVIYSASHKGKNNPQVVFALQNGIKVLNQAEAIDLLMQGFKYRVAIAGCHGKTTTTSVLIYALIKLSQTPSYIAGVSDFVRYAGADYHKSV